jgi:hypothetical protein
MSKNIVDEILDYSATFKKDIILIPSRRQIDSVGGYVNNWTTKEFCQYVKQKSNAILVERDHGGPGQGNLDDDGIESLLEDAKYMDILHIDPWKKYPLLQDALNWTLKLIQLCDEVNPNILYEVATEEAIRPISCEELDFFLKSLQEKLSPELFSKIRFVVIQCGTLLLEVENIGTFDSEKLRQMIEIVKQYNKIPKEHNGDWVSCDILRKKEELGLDYVNIAPELGGIETSIVLNQLRTNEEDFQKMYDLCYESGKWKKWVSNEFVPEENKEKLVLICGHYIFSHPSFKEMLLKYPGIDSMIRQKIREKLIELHHDIN